MARKTIKQLEEALASAQKRADENRDSGTQWQTLARQHEKTAKDLQEKFGDLKQRLHSAETENARLRGYMDRVHEDDIVRDGMIEIEDAQGRRMVPKRPAMPGAVQHEEYHQTHSHFGESKPRTHWTNY